VPLPIRLIHGVRRVGYFRLNTHVLAFCDDVYFSFKVTEGECHSVTVDVPFPQ
jgi:hypothetical protein